MAGGTGQARGEVSSEPNVVPMIDILLVLLIIFMIIQPMMRKAIDLQLPDPTPQAAPSTANPDQIVLEIGPNMVMTINKEPVSKDRLASRMKENFLYNRYVMGKNSIDRGSRGSCPRSY